jgi:hypothetical protein
MAQPRPAGAPSGPPPEQKKGEVNELRQLLRSVNTEKDSKRKRDVIKKARAGTELLAARVVGGAPSTPSRHAQCRRLTASVPPCLLSYPAASRHRRPCRSSRT